MANISKREFAKKDMNFFSEFAASSQAVARVMGYMIIGGIVVAAILVTACVVLFVRWGILKAEVKRYDDKFDSPEYATLQDDANALAAEAATINQYAYVVNSMIKQVDSETGVEFEVISEIEKHIPSNTVLTYYYIDKDKVEIEGRTHSYYSMVEIGHMLQENEFFTNSNFLEERYDPSQDYSSEQILTMYTNGEYKFSFVGTLQAKYTISVTYVSVDNKVLKVEPAVIVDAAGSQTYKEVREITIAGNTYDLVAVSLNGKTITEEQLSTVLEQDQLTVSAYGDINVQLQYTVRLSDGEGA